MNNSELKVVRKVAFAVGLGFTVGRAVGGCVNAVINAVVGNTARIFAEHGNQFFQIFCDSTDIPYEKSDESNDTED